MEYSKYIFVSFKNKIVESKYNIFFFGNINRKYQKYFWFFNWNTYLKTDSANLLILFSVNEFNTRRIRKNFYVIFLRNISINNVCIALGKTKMQKIAIQKITTE